MEDTPVDKPLQDTGWKYAKEPGSAKVFVNRPAVEPVEWTASEYIAHQKSAVWYLVLSGGAIAVAVLGYVLTKDLVPSAVVILISVLFGIIAARQPRTLTYRLDNVGITIAGKMYAYLEFKSFALVREGALVSIYLTPLKRFSSPMSIYFEPEQAEMVISFLGNYLPLEDRQPDIVERLMSRIRF